MAGVLALTLALSACAAASPAVIDLPPQVDGGLPEDTTTQLQDAVTFAMNASGASGAIVGVWAPWSGSWVTGLGTQNVGGGGDVSTKMQFRAARETRPMTCDVLYALEAKGTVSGSDSVTEYVAGVSDLDEITLDQLCDGTSGIGSYTPVLLSQWLTNPNREWDARELASYGLGQERSEPGTAYTGSDAGYLLLGLALERASGQTASQLLDEYVFRPLALDATMLPTDAAAKPSGEAPALAGHHSLRDAAGVMNCTEPLDITKISSSIGFTDSGVVTDIHDLGRYAQALAAGALTPPDADRFADPLPAYSGAPSWFTAAGGALQAGTLIGQSGAVPGYSTAAFADPETGLTVAVVLNNSAGGEGPATNLAWELAAIASKAAAATGETAPEAGLPWTAQQYHDATAAAAICPQPAP